MTIVDHFYDMRPRRLFVIALMIALAANPAWLFGHRLGWAVVAAIWLVFAALSLIAHRWNARWVVAMALAAFILPAMVSVFMHQCMATNSCP